MTFVQVIEYDTSQPEAVDALLDEWLAQSKGKRTATHGMHGHDREHPNHYADIIEFPSYEQAMVNNDLPETQKIAERMMALCDGAPRFLNIDVTRDDSF